MVKAENLGKDYDPRGLIHESYQIDGVKSEECRAIFFDWAMGSNDGAGSVAHIRKLLDIYRNKFPDHPMTETLLEGLGAVDKPRRKGGWKSRRA